MIQRAAFEHDPRYVGAVKLSLALSTVAIVLMGWLMPSDVYLDGFRASDPEAWARLAAELDKHGISQAHFADRFSSRHELLNTAATLFESAGLALVLHRFDRSRPLLSHLSFALYCYSLWLLVSLPLQFVVISDLNQTFRIVVGAGMVVLLPGLLVAGMIRLYPAPWPRQLARAVAVVALTALLLWLAAVAISVGAMAWTRTSFEL